MFKQKDSRITIIVLISLTEILCIIHGHAILPSSENNNKQNNAIELTKLNLIESINNFMEEGYKAREGRQDNEEEEDEEEDIEDDIKLGLLPKQKHPDGSLKRIFEVAPPVMKILSGAIQGNSTAMRDLFVLLAYEAASILP